MLIDTHAHLQWASFNKDRTNVMRRAQKAGVEYVINVGLDLDSSIEAIELAEKNEGLYATIGIHPHNASQLRENTVNKLRQLAENSKVVSIGEIGLDYYRNLSPKKIQQKSFEAQLLLAEELRLPVVIHDRNAHADIMEMLAKFKDNLRGIMHCFSGSREMAEECIKSDLYISFAGPVTFPNAHKLREIACRVDLNKILLETDSPWLAPQNMRGKRNEPAFLPFIAEKIAKLKGVSVKEVADATTENAKKIFRFPSFIHDSQRCKSR